MTVRVIHDELLFICEHIIHPRIYKCTVECSQTVSRVSLCIIPRVTSQCPISKIPGPFNSVHRDLQVEGCAPKILKKGHTLTYRSPKT